MFCSTHHRCGESQPPRKGKKNGHKEKGKGKINKICSEMSRSMMRVLPYLLLCFLLSLGPLHASTRPVIDNSASGISPAGFFLIFLVIIFLCLHTVVRAHFSALLSTLLPTCLRSSHVFHFSPPNPADGKCRSSQLLSFSFLSAGIRLVLPFVLARDFLVWAK